MSQQTFSVGPTPRVVITQVQGDLHVRAWKEQSISVETDGSVDGLNQEGNTLTIVDCDSDLTLQVPEDAGIKANNVDGDVSIEGVRRVELENAAGDVELKNISGDAGLENIGEAVDITNLGGDLKVTNTPALQVRHSVGGDAWLKDIATVKIETIGGDLSIRGSETVLVNTVGGDLDAEEVGATLRCGVVGGDAKLQSSTHAEAILGDIGGDFSVTGAENVQIGNIGGDGEVRDVQGDVEMGYTGGDASVSGVGGNLQVGSVGGDATLRGLQGNTEVGGVGGDLSLQAAFPPGSSTRVNVGGDASIVLPDNPNLSIRASVGGDISGRSIIASRSGNLVNLVYGDGAAHLELNVGGDLSLRGGGNPRSSSSLGGSWGDWGREFGREMANMGRELSRLGQDLSREIAAAFSEAGWSRGSGVADDVARKAEERARRARQKAEEAARKANERAARINIRLNDREWRMDPERLDRIREQARRAAEEGVAGAWEAVERAMGNLGVPKPPAPRQAPRAPEQPFAPATPQPPAPPEPPVSGVSAPTAESQSVEQAGDGKASGTPAGSLDLEREREAILRMIAEGRVTPEEGDMLLEALGG